MKKFVISFFIIASISITGTMTYAIKTLTINELIICTSNNEAFYIPQAVCEYYLINYRGSKEDIHDLENGNGLSFVANIDDLDKRYKLMDYFISKGLDVNGVSKIDGLTPLHSAILLNDPDLVQYLLSKRADPLTAERNNGMTAYKYVDFIISKDSKKLFNRDDVRNTLLKFRNKKHIKHMSHNPVNRH
ncbi:ankyrin repeat domain-containing protein [Beggiatoa alba]|nr:ankyrin repeat domain-containing protein [Beggiatoa alba]